MSQATDCESFVQSIADMTWSELTTDGDDGFPAMRCRFCGAPLLYDEEWGLSYFLHEDECVHVRARLCLGLGPIAPPVVESILEREYEIERSDFFGLTLVSCEEIGVSGAGRHIHEAFRMLIERLKQRDAIGGKKNDPTSRPYWSYLADDNLGTRLQRNRLVIRGEHTRT